jgi:hypothetical protein
VVGHGHGQCGKEEAVGEGLFEAAALEEVGSQELDLEVLAKNHFPGAGQEVGEAESQKEGPGVG